MFPNVLGHLFPKENMKTKEVYILVAIEKTVHFQHVFFRANFKTTSQQLKSFHFLPPVFPRPPLGNIIFLKNNKTYILLRFFCRRFSRDSPSEKYKFKYIYMFVPLLCLACCFLSASCFVLCSVAILWLGNALRKHWMSHGRREGLQTAQSQHKHG